MSSSRAAKLFAAGLLALCGAGCGQQYRPVAVPQSPNPPNPNFSHLAVVLSDNGGNNQGAASTIDVSGDTAVSETKSGIHPAFAILVASGTRVFVANRGDDSLSTFSATVAGSPTVITLPAGSAPNFLASTELASLYVADGGTDTVSVVSQSNFTVTHNVAVGVNPSALAELPNASRVYVANAGSGSGNGSVSVINTVDYTVNAPIAGATWSSPAWVVARADSQRVFVLDKSLGTVTELNTSGTVDTLVGSISVGAGADYMFYDANLNRLYVTNPITGIVYILDSSDAAGSISQIATVSVPGALSVAALPDGSRFYVSAESVAVGSVSASVTVFSALNFSLEKTIPLNPVTFSVQAPVCASLADTPFALSSVASADSSRVYVASCDAGGTAVISTVANNSPGDTAPEDTLVTTLNAPISAQAPGANGVPPPQNPVLVVAGP